jgi:hypothetical protein
LQALRDENLGLAADFEAAELAVYRVWSERRHVA